MTVVSRITGATTEGGGAWELDCGHTSTDVSARHVATCVQCSARESLRWAERARREAAGAPADPTEHK